MTAKEFFEWLENNTSESGSYILSFNYHKSCYTNPIDYHNLDDEDIKDNSDVDWNGNIYNLHWYKDTPVGFYSIFSNTLDGIIEKIKNSDIYET